jgi:DNA-binding transcriptional MerR regulator
MFGAFGVSNHPLESMLDSPQGAGPRLEAMSHIVTTDDLMTIGAFARKTRLSLKALRLYDELGLLRPASVDEATGYRHYSDDQVEQARLIALLRRLEMPLERIGQVLALPPADQVEAIGHYWREVEGSVAVKRRLVAYLERHLEGKGDVMYQVQTRQVAEQKVLTVSRHVKQPELVDFMMPAMGELAQALEGTPARTEFHCFVIYHGVVDADSDGPVEVCLPFEGEFDPPAGMQVRIEPAHFEAFTTVSLEHTTFPDILEAYDGVRGYLEKEGLEPTGSPREVYFVDHTRVGPTDPFCDVAWPATPARVTAGSAG